MIHWGASTDKERAVPTEDTARVFILVSAGCYAGGGAMMPDSISTFVMRWASPMALSAWA